MAVVDPIKLVLENYPEGQEEVLEGSMWPKGAPESGHRNVPFSREIWIERADFMASPDSKFRRLSPGLEVRLRFAYIVKCTEVVRDDSGAIVELRGTYDPQSKSGTSGSNRKVKGTIHWVSANHAVKAELRLYDYLFSAEVPDASDDFRSVINPDSLQVVQAYVEPHLGEAATSTHWQFERQGYFFVDPVDSKPGEPIFNRVVGLRDSFMSAAPVTPEPVKPQPTPAPKAMDPLPYGTYPRLSSRNTMLFSLAA